MLKDEGAVRKKRSTGLLARLEAEEEALNLALLTNQLLPHQEPT